MRFWILITTVAVIVVGHFFPQSICYARTWTDNQGRKVEAEYGGIKSGKVLLKMPNGKILPFPFNNLSAADQTFVKQQYALSPKTVAQEIDRLVDQVLQAKGAAPNPRTTDEEFVRRVYLEIAGTIPTFNQTLDFVESENPSKRQQLIDQLIESDEFVSHSFNWYADLLRLVSRTNDFFIYETYIDWVKTQIRAGTTYDQFVKQLLTSKGRMWDDPATGYFIRDRGMPFDNLSTTVAIFLGTEITCAQCHDHPYEDWTQKDYYQLAAFLGQRQDRMYGKAWGTANRLERDRIESEQRKINTSLGENGFVQPFRNVIHSNNHRVWDDPQKTMVLPHDYQYDDGKPNEPVKPLTIFGDTPDLSGFETPREAFADWLTGKENPMFAITAANRLWKRAFGLALHEPVDNVRIESAQNPELLKYLAQYLKDIDFDTKKFLRALYHSQAWQRQATLDGPTQLMIAKNDYLFPGPILKRMTAEQLWDSFLTLTMPDPLHFKRNVAPALTDAIKFDLKAVSGNDSIQRTDRLKELISKTIVNGAPSIESWQKVGSAVGEDGSLTKFAGAYLARASEIVQPAPAGHFLQAWGQSDRVLVNNSSDDGSIPQVLTMLNGVFPQMLIKPDSLIFKNAGGERGSANKMDNIYLSILNRYPIGKEKTIAQRAIRGTEEGYGDLIWALVNTREFIFIK